MNRALLTAACCLNLCPMVLAQDFHQRVIPSITVVGNGDVDVRPDLAEVLLGVTTESQSAAQAVTKNNEQMAQLISILKDRGIKDRDIQTSTFRVEPQYEYREGQRVPRILGYQATNMVSVRLRQLAAVGQLIDDAMKAGANRVHSIQFKVEKEANHLDQARERAMQDAKRRAELYARQAGVQVGRALLIQEQSIGFPPQPLMYERAMSADAMGGGAVPVAPGEQRLTAQVTVTYAIVDQDSKKDSEDKKTSSEKQEDKKAIE